MCRSLPFLLVIIVLTLLSITSFSVLAQDLEATQLLQFFGGVTNIPALWRISNLAVWKCGTSNCCSTSSHGGLSCTFNDKLRGKFSLSNKFTNLNVGISELRIKNNRWNKEFYDALKGPIDFAAIPKNLVRLEIGGCSLLGSSFDLAKLPRSLLHLSLTYSNLYNNVDFSKSAWPPKIIRFDVYGRGSIGGTLRIEDFPATLRYINLRPNRLNMNISTGEFRKLNTSSELRTFFVYDGNNIYGDLTDIFTVLPSTCQTFSIGGSRMNAKINGKVDFKNLAKNCPKLTNLGMRKTHLEGDFQFEYVPRNMTHLTIHENRFNNSKELNFADMPILLREVRLQNNQFVGNLDLSRVAVNGNITLLEIHDNKLDGVLTLPTVSDAALHTKWTRLSITRNRQLKGDVDCLRLPRSLVQFWADDCHSLQFLHRFGRLPPGLKEFYLTRNKMKNTGFIDWRGVPDTLQRLRLYDNNFTCADSPFSIGNFTLAPRGLIEANIGLNQFSGLADFSHVPPKMTVLQMHSNKFHGKINGFDEKFAARQVYSMRLHTNQFTGSLHSFTRNWPYLLRDFHVEYNQFYGTLDIDTRNVTRKRASERYEFVFNNNKFSGFLDLNKLHNKTSSFSVAKNNFHYRVPLDRENVPAKWSNKIEHFCNSLVLYGNNIMHMPLCNITITMSSSKTLTKTETESDSRTKSASITSIDTHRDWMLDVVLWNVKNIPRELWRAQKLKDWICNTETGRKCCVLSVDLLYDCSFTSEKNNYFNGGGRIEIKFPPDYPLYRFELKNSRASAVARFYEMPTRLKHVHFEGTNVLTMFEFPPRNVMQIGKMMTRSLETLILRGTRLKWLNQRGAGSYTSISFDDVPSSLKHLEVSNIGGCARTNMCGDQILQIIDGNGTKTSSSSQISSSSSVNPAAFSHLPSTLETFSLAGQELSGTININSIFSSNKFPSLKKIDFSYNTFSSISSTSSSKNPLSNLPQQLTNFSISNNRISLKNNNNTVVPFLFSELPPQMQSFDISNNNIGWNDLDVNNLPESLRFFSLKNNFFGGTRFEVEHLTNYFENHLKEFCANIIPQKTQPQGGGGGFLTSFTCGITFSNSLSKSRNSLSETLSLIRSNSDSLSNSFSIPKNSPSKEFSESKSVASSTISSSRSESLAKLSETELASSTISCSKSESLSELSETKSSKLTKTADDLITNSSTLELTKTSTFQIPIIPYTRDKVLTAALYAGAAAAATLSPTAAAAAIIVSRQTAVARALGPNGTCGGPTYEDPLPWFEDPLNLDFDPTSCIGKLSGVFVGNVCVSFGIFWLLWCFYGLRFWWHSDDEDEDEDENNQEGGKKKKKKKKKKKEKKQLQKRKDKNKKFEQQEHENHDETNTTSNNNKSVVAIVSVGEEEKDKNSKIQEEIIDDDEDNISSNRRTTARREQKEPQCPTPLQATESGWPIEALYVFGFGFLLPPALSCIFVAAARCQYSSWAAFVGVVSLLFFSFVTYHLMARRIRYELFLTCETRIQGNQKCWLIGSFLAWWFAPSGEWRWKPTKVALDREKARLKRERIEEVAERRKNLNSLLMEEKEFLVGRSFSSNNNVNNSNNDNENLMMMSEENNNNSNRNKKKSKTSPSEQLDTALLSLAALSSSTSPNKHKHKMLNNDNISPKNTQSASKKSSSAAAAASSSTPPRTSISEKNEESSPSSVSSPLSPRQQIEQAASEAEAASHEYSLEEQRLRFESANRLLDKYVDTSWWFLGYELGIRALMTPAPAFAELVPNEYSCLLLRLWYLLCVNALLVAVWFRRPYAHRALFWATTVAAACEIIVLLFMMVQEFDSGVAISPALLTAAQIFAIIMTVGIEAYCIVLGPRYWPFVWTDKRLLDDATYGEIDGDVKKFILPGDKNNANKNEVEGGEEMSDKNSSSSSDNDDDDVGDSSDSEMSSSSSDSDSENITNLSDLEKQQENNNNDSDDDNDDDDEFDRLDRRLRRAFVELVQDEDEPVEAHGKLVRAQQNIDEYLAL